MKNLYFRKNNIFIKKDYLTGKNSNQKELNHNYLSYILNQDKSKKIKYSPSQKYFSNLGLTNRPINISKKIIYSQNLKDYNSDSIIYNDLKLNSIRKKKLFTNEELDKYTIDLFDSRNNFNNTKIFKKTMNQSSQSDFFFDEEDQESKLKREHYLKIDDLLNKKMTININRPKLRKISFKFNNEKNNFINDLKSNNNDNDKYHILYYQKLKPLQYYFKTLNKKETKDNTINTQSKLTKIKSRNNSTIKPKTDSFDEKSIYEVVNNLENNKVFYTSKLNIYDNLSKNTKENNFYLKKTNDKMISNYSKLLENKFNVLANKYRFNSMQIKNRNVKKIKFISNEKMKILSNKGFQQLKVRKLENLNNQIKNVIGVIEKNKKQFQNIMKMNGQIYTKNKKISLIDVDEEIIYEDN